MLGSRPIIPLVVGRLPSLGLRGQGEGHIPPCSGGLWYCNYCKGGVDAVGAGEEEAGGRGPGCRGRLTASISGGGGVRGGARAVVAGTQPGVGL